MGEGQKIEEKAEGRREQTKALCVNIILISEGQSNVSIQGALAVTSVKTRWMAALFFYYPYISYYFSANECKYECFEMDTFSGL